VELSVHLQLDPPSLNSCAGGMARPSHTQRYATVWCWQLGLHEQHDDLMGKSHATRVIPALTSCEQHTPCFIGSSARTLGISDVRVMQSCVPWMYGFAVLVAIVVIPGCPCCRQRVWCPSNESGQADLHLPHVDTSGETVCNSQPSGVQSRHVKQTGCRVQL